MKKEASRRWKQTSEKRERRRAKYESMEMKIPLTEIQLKHWNEINKCYAIFVRRKRWGKIKVYTTNNKK